MGIEFRGWAFDCFHAYMFHTLLTVFFFSLRRVRRRHDDDETSELLLSGIAEEEEEEEIVSFEQLRSALKRGWQSQVRH